MANYFLDSSAIVKRYLTEVGSSWVRALTDPVAGNDIYLAQITGVEVTSALVRQVPSLPAALLQRALADFKSDWQGQYQVVILNTAVIARAMSLAEKLRLRGFDAVQLGAAVELLTVALGTGLPPLTFVSADTQLNAAAAAEGFVVDNPNAHP